MRYVNANWSAGQPDDGAFEVMIVTEDERRHSLSVGATQMAVLVALTQARDVVMLWDPEGQTLIAANLVGEWIQSSWSAGGRRATAHGAPSEDGSGVTGS